MHLAFNLVGLFLASFFLEFTNRSWRVALVFYSGVMFASIVVTAINPIPLVGMSGGVYAMMTATLGDLALNWRDDNIILRQRVRKHKKTMAIGSTFVRLGRLGLTSVWILTDVGKTLYEM